MLHGDVEAAVSSTDFHVVSANAVYVAPVAACIVGLDILVNLEGGRGSDSEIW